MINIFLDTNILIYFLADRRPISLEAARIFDNSLKRKFRIFISAVSYNNIYYILRQSFSHNETIKLLAELNEWTEIIDVSKDIIEKSIRSEFKDFEDAIQYYCALSTSKIEFIVTRDTKDFKTSKIPILTPKEANSLIQNTGR
jgi:predicted nucleic acid-binding protein